MKIENVEITKSELTPFLDTCQENDLNNKVKALIKHQLDPEIGFPTLIKNIDSYKESESSTIRIDGLDFRIFFNPTRAKNVKASTFTDHDENFSCFLCDLLPGQKGIKYLNDKYMMIVNPGITIPGDLTIPTINHELQKLEPHFSDMLEFAEKLTDYSIYFNGPLAGATCPHFHFQAGIRDRLPAEKLINNILESDSYKNISKDFIFKNRNTEIFRLKNFLRSNYCIYSNSKDSVLKFSKNFFQQIKIVDKKFIQNLPNIPDFGSEIKVFGEHEEEGRFNVMAKYYPETKKYFVVFFPKLFNRPQSYFEKGTDQITLGFAIKEALGHTLVATKKDLYRILENKDILKQAYLDTNLSNEMDEELINSLNYYYLI